MIDSNVLDPNKEVSGEPTGLYMRVFLGHGLTITPPEDWWPETNYLYPPAPDKAPEPITSP